VSDDGIPVLLYHAVSDVARPGLERWTVSRAAFDDHVARIAASGRVPLTIPELADGLRGERPLPDRPVAVTFDDGYDDTLAAVGLLADRGIAATVYATVSSLGTTGMLTADHLADLARVARVEVGAHGMTHRRLDELDRADIVHELVASRGCIEAMTGRPCTTFAYPHGAHDRRVLTAVVAAGYRSGAAVKNALSHRGDDPFAIARVTIEAGTSTSDLERVLAGVRGLAPRHDRLRTRGYRWARRTRSRLLAGTARR